MENDHKFWPTQPVSHDPTTEKPHQIITIDKEQVPKKALPTPAYIKFDVVD
jgi:hypothetical protein